jgi:hypothetical protein
MTSPRPPDGPDLRNPATWFPRYFGAQPPEAPRPLDLPAAYATALRLQRERPPLLGPGYRLYWMTATRIASRDVLAEGPSELVVGRHTVCDAVLEGDASIALRHLLVRSTLLDDGCPRLSILDLESDSGFYIPDGTVQRSICAAGPLALRVGAYSIVALPGGVALPDALPSPVCDRPNDRVVSPARAPMSRITLLPRATLLSQRPTMRMSSLGPAPARRPTHDYELSLLDAKERVSVCLSAAELERGLLVGRATKCIDAGLRAILNTGISRLHLLLLRDGSECRAYDLASTQGTFQDGRAVRQVPLDDDGTTLELGTSTGIRLTWRRVSPDA